MFRKPKVSYNYCFWDISTAIKTHVRTVPMLSPTGDKPDDDATVIKKGLQSYYPWLILPDNPAANKDLTNIMALILHSFCNFLKHKYSFIRVDIKLFIRWFMVNFFVLFLLVT